MATLEEPAVGLGNDNSFDEKWEFDCPRFHDFQNGTPPGENPDDWFNTSATKGLASPEAQKQQSQDTSSIQGQEQQLSGGSQKDVENAPSAAFGSQPQTSKAAQAPAGEAEQVRAVLAHITNNTVTRSKGPASAAKQASGSARKATPKQKTVKVTPKSAKPVSEKKASPPKAAPVTRAAAATSAVPVEKPAPAEQAAAEPSTKKTPRSTRPEKRSVSKPAPSRKPPVASQPAAKAPPAVRPPRTKQQKPAARPHITVPRSPFLRSKQRSTTHRHQQAKTTEELELEEVERAKKEAAALRRLNSKSVGAALQGRAAAPRQPPKRKPPTEPSREPNLRTAKRQRMHTMQTRSHSPAPSPWKSTAQRVAEFTRGASTRSQASTRPGSSRQQQPQRRGRAQLTVPHTPRFATTRRARAPRFKPTEEEEAERAAKEAQALKVKLHNKRKTVVPPPPAPVRRSQRKPLTEFQPFSFATDARAATRTKPASNEPAPFVFGADGPVTRSRARVVTTAAPVPQRTRQQQEQVDAPHSGGSSGSGSGGRYSFRSLGTRNRATSGPMMLGGAVRVLRNTQEDGNEGSGSDGDVQMAEAANEGYAEEQDGMQAVIRTGATLHNPLFHA